MKSCPRCGYVRGTTTGYTSLTEEERGILEQAGYTLTKNVFGEDLARRTEGGYGFNTARFCLHKVLCRSTVWDRLLRRRELV